MPVPPAGNRAFHHNLSSANQISGLLPEIEFDPERVVILLRESGGPTECTGEQQHADCCRPSLRDCVSIWRLAQTPYNPLQPDHICLTRNGWKSSGERTLPACRFRHPVENPT